MHNATPTAPASAALVLDRFDPTLRAVAGFLAGYGNELTRDNYARDLRQFGRWVESNGVALFDAQRAHIELWARTLETTKARATVARQLSTVVCFYRYCFQEELTAKDPARNVRRIKVSPESNATGLDRSELGAFLYAAAGDSPRNHALGVLLGINGLRVGEALSIDVGDLGHERGHRTVAIIGKGAKPATVPLPPRVARAIDALAEERGSGPLFLGAGDGKRLRRDAAARIVRRIAKRAGIAKHITPHSLRHSAITAALDAGVPLRDVQTFARHADPRTTTRYDRARLDLDRHAAYNVASFVAGAA
jgi:integrase/recombinase XerD